MSRFAAISRSALLDQLWPIARVKVYRMHFSIWNPGILFIIEGERVYEGMIIGEHNRDSDLNVNPCKEKKLTNHRASGKDENVVLTPIIPMTLERAIEFIREGEIVEVTPANIRLRKVLLSATGRHTARPPKL